MTEPILSEKDLVIVRDFPIGGAWVEEIRHMFQDKVCEIVKVTPSNYPNYPWYTVYTLQSQEGNRMEFFHSQVEPVFKK